MSHHELTEILSKHFTVSLSNNELDTESAYLKYIQKKLATRIEFFINTDMEKLLQILYRIDVTQKYSDEAFGLGEISKISMKLSELIIKRQLEKIEYSRKFKGDQE